MRTLAALVDAAAAILTAAALVAVVNSLLAWLAWIGF